MLSDGRCKQSMIIGHRVKNKRNVDFGTAKVSLSEIRESVGFVFFVWSRLERALREAVHEMDASVPKRTGRGIAQTLDLWHELHMNALPQNTLHSEFIQELLALFTEGLEIRNRLAHGIIGWSVAGGDKNDAYISTLMNDKEVIIHLAELRSITDQMGSVFNHLDRLTSFALKPDRWKHSDLHAEIRNLLQRSRER